MKTMERLFQFLLLGRSAELWRARKLDRKIAALGQNVTGYDNTACGSAVPGIEPTVENGE